MLITEQKKRITCPADLAAVLRALLATEDEIGQEREHFWTIGLNTKNVIQYVELVHLGSLNASLVHPREVFRLAVLKGANSIVVGHNHPSGDLTPSREDIAVTQRLDSAANILGITLADHVIIGNGNDGYSSWREHHWQ